MPGFWARNEKLAPAAGSAGFQPASPPSASGAGRQPGADAMRPNWLVATLLAGPGKWTTWTAWTAWTMDTGTRRAAPAARPFCPSSFVSLASLPSLPSTYHSPAHAGDYRHARSPVQNAAPILHSHLSLLHFPPRPTRRPGYGTRARPGCRDSDASASRRPAPRWPGLGLGRQ